MGLFKSLTETDEHEAQRDSTPQVTTKTLAEMAETPASELFVVEKVAAHSRGCWVRQWVKSFRLVLVFCAGIYVAVQAASLIVLRSALQNLDARTAATVEAVLRKHKLIVEAPKPSERDWSFIPTAAASPTSEASP